LRFFQDAVHPVRSSHEDILKKSKYSDSAFGYDITQTIILLNF
jgi:hypothetical protein